MSTYVVTATEKLREKDTEWGKKQVLKLRLKNTEGIEKTAEWFTSIETPAPAEGEKIEGEVTDSGQFGLQFKKARPGGGGNKRSSRSPADTKAIQRQHSQEMALRYHHTLVGVGNRPFNMEQIHELTNWFEQDISGKQPKGITIDPLKSDVPGDTLDFGGST